MASDTPKPINTTSSIESSLALNQAEKSEENELKPAYWRRWYFWLAVFLVLQILFFSFFTYYFK